MLDLLLIRADKGGKPEIVYESQKKRFKSTEIVDKAIELDKKWKELRGKADTAKMNQNNVEREIKEKKKASKGQDPCTELIAKKAQLEKEAIELDNQANELLKEVKKIYSQVGNIIHESVPVSKDEVDNKVVISWVTID